MSQRHQYGNGSVYQRKDGRWVAVIGVAGKRVSRYARSEKDAKRILLDLQVENRQGTLRPPSKVTVGEWIEDWLRIKAPALRPSTERTYRSALSTISNDIGHLRIDKLTPLLLTQTFSRLIEKRHGVRRLHLSHTCLKACLEQAVDLGLMATNPIARVPKPHWEQQPSDYWTIAGASRFIDTCLNIGWRRAPLLAFLTATGVRISEALGLQWSDIDMVARNTRASCRQSQ